MSSPAVHNLVTPCIYALTDPRNGEVRYIGKAKGHMISRLGSHISGALAVHPAHRGPQLKGYVTFSKKDVWIRELLVEGLVPGVVMIKETTLEYLASDEKIVIAEHKSRGVPLVNGNGGGAGGAIPWSIGYFAKNVRKLIST